MAHSLTDKDTGDITEIAGLLATVEGQIASMIADGAYDGVSLYDAAVARQRNRPLHIVIPSRASSLFNSKVNIQTVLDRHVWDIVEKGRIAWQKANGYGRRSIVETTIGRHKHIIGPKLKARSSDGQKGEVIAICAPNQMIRIAKPISVSAL